VTGNHPTSTGPISIAAIRTQVLIFNTLVPRKMQLGFSSNSSERNAEIDINNIGCSVNKVGFMSEACLLV
jgi:hypothetical protein